MKKSILYIFSLFLISSCLSEDELKKPFVSYVPPALNDGWEISTPADEQMDEAKLKEIYSDFHHDKDSWQVRSLLVFRNGKLVAESYTKDDQDRTTPRAIWSCTKQVMGLLTGIALDKGIIGGVTYRIGNYLPEIKDYPDKEATTIENLLTMKSGIDYSNDGLGGQTDDILRQKPDHITEFILARPLSVAPGNIATYKDCDPQLLAAVLDHACGQSTTEWAKQVLFDPLEIANLEWDKYRDGTTLGGFGILTTPREMAKFGQCVLDSGMWKETRVVSQEWIREMTTERVKKLYNNYSFGYLWWKDPARNMTFMSGHGGQYVCLLPDKKLMVVITSEANTQGESQFGDEAFDIVDKIAEAAN
jgi:CubicO group peptidase (beta-lactamase class C family)